MNHPQTLEEAVAELMRVYKGTPALEQLANMKEEDLISVHHGLGTSIRNNFGMWEPASPLVIDISTRFNNGQLLHTDDACFALIGAFWSAAKKEVPKVLKKGKWLTFCEKDGYEYFHRHNKPNAVAIVAITTNNELVIIEQKRVPHDKMVVEIPAGLVDEGESFEETAVRELLEETGYGDGTIVKTVHDIPATPGICSERLSFVIITDVKKIGKGGGLAEENEVINVFLHPLDQPYIMKVQNPDKYYDLKLLAGLQLAYQWKRMLP